MDDGKVLERMRATLGIPDFAPEIHLISRWTMEGVLANKFHAGTRLSGRDAAHRHPPTGGLGLNSAVHDAYNLCWKLAAVLRGKAGAKLLETYGQERRPVDGANVEAAVNSAMNHFTSTRRFRFPRKKVLSRTGMRSAALAGPTELRGEATWTELRHRIPDDGV